MNVIKRHKGLAIIATLSLILLVVIFIILSRMLFQKNNSVYGDRLNEMVELDDSIKDKIINEYKEKAEVKDITYRLQGKIIYITLKLKEGTKKDKAKELASKIIEYYPEEVISYYDFGFFIEEIIEKPTDEKKGFIISGTKHPNNISISWTK